MTQVEVSEASPGEFEVVITEGSTASTHTVSVSDAMRDELGVGDVDGRTLVKESFRFLLEHEPMESILGRFELTVIGRYFPEYPEEIRRRLRIG